MVERNVPVAAIEGIGPRTSERLQAIGIYSVFDLLRLKVEDIHPAVAPQSSPEQVRMWARAAALLQLDAVTPQWAEALCAGGIDTVHHLASSGIEELRLVFGDALGSGTIPGSPTDTQIVDMLKDAVAVVHTGVLRGTVLDHDGKAAAGAAVRLGTRRATADARGHFDILRIPLGINPPLVVDHGGLSRTVDDHPNISRDLDRIAVQVYQLSAADGAPVFFSELDGDKLPALPGRRIRSRIGDRDSLREHDILLVRGHRAADDSYRAVSKLKSIDNADVIVHVYRLPASMFPERPATGDAFRVVAGALQPGSAAPAYLRRYRHWLQMRRKVSGDAIPGTDDEFRAHAERHLDALMEQGFFRRIRRRR